MSVYNELGLTRACLDSLRTTTEPFHLAVVDNGSTDDTPAFFAHFPYPYPLRFARNATNQSVIASLNRAARLADTEVLCFLHNDVEMRDPRWPERPLAALAEPAAGLAGLYGIKRANGRYVGRTIVHSLAEGPTVRRPWEDVAVVDSVCMCPERKLFDEIGGLDEGYGFYHGLDRELSFAVRERGRRCLVAYAPFVHHGGATRARDFGARPEHAREDLSLRAAVLDRFVARYRHRLPCDVRSPGRRVRDWVRAKLGRR
ncbi:MAG: glycosyltransferase [Candidatus Rokubacteria bacterium]|nr:glycosyltransferase [Candidatus Rokubacteria bacterium]